MANSKISALTNYTTPDGVNDVIPIVDVANLTTKKITRNNYLGITGSPLGTSDTQNVTNKTLDNTNTITLKGTKLTLQDDADTSKQARFIMSGITTATTRSYTLPNASGTLVDLNTTQALTNKTLTSPVITGGSIDNSTVTVDAVSGHTSANTGTIYGVAVTSSKISGTSLTNATVGPNQLATGATTASVTTSETTSSTSYTDLTTTTDTVTVTVGANGIVLLAIACDLQNSSTQYSIASFAASGANTIAASDTQSVLIATNATVEVQGSWVKVITALAAGSTTFKMKYRVTGGTGTFKNRNISVVPL